MRRKQINYKNGATGLTAVKPTYIAVEPSIERRRTIDKTPSNFSVAIDKVSAPVAEAPKPMATEVPTTPTTPPTPTPKVAASEADPVTVQPDLQPDTPTAVSPISDANPQTRNKPTNHRLWIIIALVALAAIYLYRKK